MSAVGRIVVSIQGQVLRYFLLDWVVYANFCDSQHRRQQTDALTLFLRRRNVT